MPDGKGLHSSSLSCFQRLILPKKGTPPPRITGTTATLSLAMAVSTLATLAGLVFAPRQLDGSPLWAKPFKFSASILIYAVTLSCLLDQLARRRRLAWWAGAVSAVFLTVEMVIIGAAVRPDAVFTFWGVTLLATAGLAVVLVLTLGRRAVVALHHAALRPAP